MCTELILALIYFITIVYVNYFLLNIFKINLENIFFLGKIKKILKNFKGNKKKSIIYYLIQLFKNEKNNKLLNYLNQEVIISDILIIGSTYKFLLKNFSLIFKFFPFFCIFEEKFKEKKELIFSNKLYLNLLETHYLFPDN